MVQKEDMPKKETKKFDVWKLLNILSPILSLFIITVAVLFIREIL